MFKSKCFSAMSISLLALALTATAGCSMLRPNPEDLGPLPFPLSRQGQNQPKLFWNQKLEGKLTDLSVAERTGHVLISEVLEGIVENRTRVSLFSAEGRRLWSTTLTAPVRAQALSSGSDWLVLSTYDEELIRLDPRTGKPLWKLPDMGMCRPLILEKTSRVLCHHDDDASPGIVFDVLDESGKKTHQQRAPFDSLVLKVSGDESRILIGFVRGRVWLLDSEFKKRWETQLEGEIVDASVASPSLKPDTEAALLVNHPSQGQSLIILPTKASRRQSIRQHTPLQQLILADHGRWISVYGNSPRGQAVAQYDTQPQLQERWSQHSPRYADYNLKMDLLNEWTLLGFENVSDRNRRAHLLALDQAGAMKWSIPLQTDDGAYLYAQGLSQAQGLIVVGTDDGQISAYRVLDRHANLPSDKPAGDLTRR